MLRLLCIRAMPPRSVSEKMRSLPARRTKQDSDRLDRSYDERFDCFIEPDFFERKSREWRQTQKQLANQIVQYEEAAHDYVRDGIRLLELSKRLFLSKQQDSSEKRKLLNFVCSNLTWKDHTRTATFRQPFDLLAITNTTWQQKGRRSRLLEPCDRVVTCKALFGSLSENCSG